MFKCQLNEITGELPTSMHSLQMYLFGIWLRNECTGLLNKCIVKSSDLFYNIEETGVQGIGKVEIKTKIENKK